MSQQTLKELLKPPFYHEGGYLHDQTKIAVAAVGYDQEMICDFIVAAMNEKWERENSESLHWIPRKSLGYDWINCPKCDMDYRYYPDISFKFCPYCGQKLLPPKENQ